MNLDATIEEIIKANLGNYNNITKQAPEFVHQIILVSCLENFLNSGKVQNKENFKQFLKDTKSQWENDLRLGKHNGNDLIFNEILGSENDIVKKFTIAARFGLVRNKVHTKTLEDDLEFNNIQITDLFFEIKKLCFGSYYNTYSYKDTLMLQLALFTNTKGQFRRLYVLELLYLLTQINYFKKEEMKVFHFLFNPKEDKIAGKLQLIIECIKYLRQQVDINKSNFDKEFETLFSSNKELYNRILEKEGEDRLWQTLQDNFNVKYGLAILYNEKEKTIYSQDQKVFLEQTNLYQLSFQEFQNYLCKPKNLIDDSVDKDDNMMINEMFPFRIYNHIEQYDFNNEFKATLFPQKILYENQENDYLNSKCNKNVILFGNPNSGKSRYVKDTILNCYKTTGIPFYHKEIAILSDEVKPFSKLFAYEDLSGTIQYSVFYETVVNAIKNFRTPHINYFDEMGEHDFTTLFGSLKNILKNANRVDMEQIYTSVSNKEEFIKDLKSIVSLDTFNAFIDKYETFINPTNIVNIPVGKKLLRFFIPSNYLFIGTSNYAPIIRTSLSIKNGFSERGDRFKSIHFYEGIDKYNFFFNSEVNSLIIDFNRKLLKLMEKPYEFEHSTIKQLDEIKYQCLISNFHVCHDLNIKELKESAIKNIEDCMELDDIKELIEEIKDLK